MALLAEYLVGRTDELDSFERLLDEVGQGRSAAIRLVGEPGIGKTRLLREFSDRAARRGHLVLSGSASELERDLPFSVFVDALDEHLETLGPPRLAVLDQNVRAELAHVFPSLAALAVGGEVAPRHERHRSHRAVRELLERIAATTPVVLTLDDMHWADAASVELLGALLRRPPAGFVLIALAVRPHQVSERLAGVLERARREAHLATVDLDPLSLAEAREFLGEAFDDTQAAALFEESGGNPFYLEQLTRVVDRAVGGSGADTSIEIGVPPPVAAALSEELALLSEDARVAFQGAAVAGDPFEPELAAAASRTSEASAIEAVDELLQLDLVRPTDVPRRFRFRHPLVRRAVYEATPGGWRLQAHERCAAALAARGATAVARAHHVERSAREGDLAAVAVLREASEAAARLAPASSARWFAATLRLLPQTASGQERVELLLAHASALAATGAFAESHQALLNGLAVVPDEASELRTKLATECASVEHRLGQYEQAHARLVNALGSLPDPVSSDAVALLIELARNELYRSDYQSMHEWAGRAASTAEALGDVSLMAAAMAMPALADAMTGAGQSAQSHRARAVALVDSLSDGQLSRRLDAAAWLAAAELYLDLYPQADAHASRALTLARASGQEELFLVLYQILGRVWYVRGKLAQAADLLDGAIEASRLLSHTQTLAGNLFNRSVVAVAVGDLETGVATAEESVELARDLDRGFVSAWAAVRLASALLETGRPEPAVELLIGSAGGDELALIPGGWRAYCLELLTRCWLALGQPSQAERTAACAHATAAAVRLPLAAAWADRAAAAVALHAGDTNYAVGSALSSATTAEQVGAPIEAALSRTLAGHALADARQRDRAVVELERAAAELDGCGAIRYRDQAERELGKLGHRIHRRTRPGRTDSTGIESLTGRELQVARLVAAGKTNPQIAAELFLSKKTVETHLHTIFRKMEVSSRLALAREIDRAHPSTPSQ